MTIERSTQPLTQLEFEDADFRAAERMAKALGYEQTAYTTSSALWGMFCLPESPEHINGRRCTKCQDRPGLDGLGRICKACGGDGWTTRPHPKAQSRKGCIIKTRELGLLFVQDAEDLGL